MGLGVFAGADIAEGQILDEYHGELIPPRMAADRDDDDYIFGIDGIASSSARDYGNWTRFINHACLAFNVEAIEDVLGGRRTITYRALSEINKGDQLFIDYGKNYFGDAGNHILCTCGTPEEPHLPPGQADSVPETQQAFPSTQAQPAFTWPPDVSIRDQNDWIARHKRWLSYREPNGCSRWTMVHWRFLEQLIRRRRHYKNWRSNSEYANLPSSKGHSLLSLAVRYKSAQMTIHEWHLDVVKAFQQDGVCGKRQGEEWDTKDLLKRIFAVNVAAMRRRNLSGRKRSFARTPPLIQEPETPEAGKTGPGNIPTPPTTGRQAKRASDRRRRRQWRSYSP